MKVLRTSETDTNKLQMGDVIRLKDGYTATCQAVTETGAIMLLDQYLDFDAPMNEKNTNRGGYEASDLRKWLQDQLDEFLPEDLEKRLKTFENGDLLRLPYYGEIFDHLDPEYVEGVPGRSGLSHQRIAEPQDRQITAGHRVHDRPRCRDSDPEDPAAKWQADLILGSRRTRY